MNRIVKKIKQKRKNSSKENAVQVTISGGKRQKLEEEKKPHWSTSQRNGKKLEEQARKPTLYTKFTGTRSRLEVKYSEFLKVNAGFVEVRQIRYGTLKSIVPRAASKNWRIFIRSEIRPSFSLLGEPSAISSRRRRRRQGLSYPFREGKRARTEEEGLKWKVEWGFRSGAVT